MVSPTAKEMKRKCTAEI